MKKLNAKQSASSVVIIAVILVLTWLGVANSNPLSYKKLGANVRNANSDQVKLLGETFWITDSAKIYLIDVKSHTVISQAILPDGFKNISIVDGDATQVVLQNAADGTYKIYSSTDKRYYDLAKETSVVFLTGAGEAVTQNIVGESTSDIYVTNFIAGVSQKIGVWDEAYPISLQRINANEYFVYSEPSDLLNQPLFKLTVNPGKIEKYQDNFGFNLKISQDGSKILFNRVDQNGAVASIIYDIKTKTETNLNQTLSHFLSYFDGDKLVVVSDIDNKSYIMVYDGGKEISKQPFRLNGAYSIAKYGDGQVITADKNGLKIMELSR